MVICPSAGFLTVCGIWGWVNLKSGYTRTLVGNVAKLCGQIRCLCEANECHLFYKLSSANKAEYTVALCNSPLTVSNKTAFKDI